MADIILDSFPFDSMEVLDEETEQMKPDREYEAEVFRKYFNMFLSNGVYYGDYNNYKENSMKVTADGGMNIRVAKGAGLIKGANFENTEERIITLERPASGSRIDRIVVQMNAGLDTRATKLIVKKGNSTTPAALQRDENIYEICIAQITVKSTTNITSADIVDKRANKDVCGIVNSLITVDGEELYQRFQDYIDSVTDNLVRKDQNNTIEGSLTVNGGIDANIKPKRLTYEDLNDIKNTDDTGFYYAVGGNQVTNRPSGVDGFSMIANRGGETPFVQMLISTSQNIGKYYYRIYQSTNASWGEWIEIHNSKFYDIVQEQTITAVDDDESKITLTFKRNGKLVTIQGKWQIKNFQKFSGVGVKEINIPEFAKISKNDSSAIRMTTSFTLATIVDYGIEDFATIHLQKNQNKYEVIAWGDAHVNRTFNLMFTPYFVD